jgi:hypothetical protein
VHRRIFCRELGKRGATVKAPSFYRDLFKGDLWDWEDQVAIISPMSAPIYRRNQGAMR